MSAMPATKGFLIAIEGIDGAGKTTLARALAERLRVGGVAVVLDREPTTGPWGSQLRASAATGRLAVDEEIRLLLADRREHVEQVIGPALDRGDVVILDRYYPSMAAYQGAAGREVTAILAANAFAPEPDLTLVLDLPPTTGLGRIRARGDAPNVFETESALTVSRELFLSMPLPSRRVIDASQGVAAVLHDAVGHILVEVANKTARTNGVTVESVERVRQIGVAVTA